MEAGYCGHAGDDGGAEWACLVADVGSLPRS